MISLRITLVIFSVCFILQYDTVYASKSVERRKVAHPGRDTAKTIIQLAKRVKQPQQSLESHLHNLGRKAEANLKRFFEILKTLVKEKLSAEHFAKILDTSNTRTVLAHVHDKVGGVLTSIHDMDYFAEIIKVTGNYYGWYWVDHYMSGSEMSDKWTETSLVIGRLMAALRNNDLDRIVEIGSVLDEVNVGDGNDEEVDLFVASTLAIESCDEELSKSELFWELLEAMEQSAVLSAILEGGLKAHLINKRVDWSTMMDPKVYKKTLEMAELVGDASVKAHISSLLTKRGESHRRRH